MSTTFNWAGLTSRGTVLTTELNSVGNGAFSAVGTAIDNTSNLDQWAVAEIVLASLTPTTGAWLQLFLVASSDGTNYSDAPSSTNPGGHQFVGTFFVTTGAGAKRFGNEVMFRVPPGKWKFVALNQSGVALASSGNTVTIYTTNEKGN